MALSHYQKKRNFKQTPEPTGEKASSITGQPIFVVQKHAASHLHYDFRLEVNGVLKSWAIPKGPSLDPKEKRFAAMVEDHPFDYKDFEGIIPEGNYGAGSVIVWDSGTFRLLNATNKKDIDIEAEKEIKDGHLTFILEGQKLKGEFALIHIQRGKPKDWLLVKKRDQYADGDPISDPRSVKSGRTLEEIAKNPPDFWLDKEYKQIEKAPKTEMPRSIKPMLATLFTEPFSSPDWLFEIKLDGFRAITEIRQGQVSLYSRNLLSFNQKFPEIISDLMCINHDLIIDGEIVVLDEEGRSQFSLLQDYWQSKKGNLVYYVFDLIYLDGRNLEKVPLVDRKTILKLILPSALPHVSFTDHIEGERGKDFFKLIKKNGLEGVVAKKNSSIYKPGLRTKDWLKIKNKLSQEVVIAGFLKSQRRELSSLLLGVYDKSGLHYVGNVGTGFSEKTLAKLTELLTPIKQEESPFCDYTKNLNDQFWVEPKYVCEVKFAEWTSDNKLRQPVYLGLRDDISPEQVVREVPIR